MTFCDFLSNIGVGLLIHQLAQQGANGPSGGPLGNELSTYHVLQVGHDLRYSTRCLAGASSAMGAALKWGFEESFEEVFWAELAEAAAES